MSEQLMGNEKLPIFTKFGHSRDDGGISESLSHDKRMDVFIGFKM